MYKRQAYSLFWGILPFSLEIDQTFIGAILTAIGYSINDKVVDVYKRQYINRGNNNDKNDNKEVISKIISLRLEKANLLGFDCYRCV